MLLLTSTKISVGVFVYFLARLVKWVTVESLIKTNVVSKVGYTEIFGNNFVHGGNKRRGAKVVMVCLVVKQWWDVAFEKLFRQILFWRAGGRGLNHILFPMQRQCGLCIRELKKLLLLICSPNPNLKLTLDKNIWNFVGHPNVPFSRYHPSTYKSQGRRKLFVEGARGTDSSTLSICSQW